MPLNVAGFKIGHSTNQTALTGCTVILCPPNTVGSCDIRGSSPATRETALLAPDKSMGEVHAVLLAGGSAFGLAAADGVMKYLEERNIGYQTPWLRVPIVPSAAVFDMNVGDKTIRPSALDGYDACRTAISDNTLQGNIGAGTGATIGKWAGLPYAMKGGVGMSTVQLQDAIVGCLAVVNSVGDVVDSSGAIIAGACDHEGRFLAERFPLRANFASRLWQSANTTLIVLATNVKLTKVQLQRLAQRGHDGMARAIRPVHTSYDGDLVFTLSAGTIGTNFDLAAEMAAEAVSQSIWNAALHAKNIAEFRGAAGE